MTMERKRKKKVGANKKDSGATQSKIKRETKTEVTQNDNLEEGVLSIRFAARESGKGIKGEAAGWIISCPHCKEEYSDIKAHIKRDHRGKQFMGLKVKCPLCEKNVVDIQNHIKFVHEVNKKYACNECDSKFKTRTILNTHIAGVHKGLTTKCPHCDMTLKTTTLPIHIKRVHENKRKEVKCDQGGCDKVYTSRADMQRHVLRVHLKLRTKCEFCAQEFSPDQMPRHIKKEHQGIFRIYCKHCQKGFDSNRSLEMHTTTQHSGIFIQCNIPSIDSEGEPCKRQLLTEKGFEEHTKRHLAKDYKILCQRCGAEIYSCYQQEHDSLFHGISQVACDFDGCDARVNTRQQLKAHALENHAALMEYLEWCDSCHKPVFNKENHTRIFHKEINDQEFTLLHRITIGQMCEEEGCKFFAVNKGAIKYHNKVVHNKSAMVECQICHNITNNLEKHMTNNHSEEKIFKCDLCDGAFFQAKQLTAHKRIHTRQKEECEICHSQVIQLKQHMDQVHANIRPYECEVEGCPQKFFTKLQKTKHVMHVHEGMRYKCSICSQEVSNIRVHMRFVHFKEKKHECPECGKMFQTNTHMRTHLKRVHLGVRHKCDICGKLVQDLNSHNLFIHKQAKNFPCDQCDKRYSTMPQLRVHISLKHIEEEETKVDPLQI